MVTAAKPAQLAQQILATFTNEQIEAMDTVQQLCFVHALCLLSLAHSARDIASGIEGVVNELPMAGKGN